MEEAVIFVKEEFGDCLSGNFLADRLGDRIDELIKENKKVILDFDGVFLLSPSFAWRCFAKRHIVLRHRFSQYIAFRNLSDSMKNLIRGAIVKEIDRVGHNKTGTEE